MERRLGLASATALVVANSIGAGVFTTSGFALADLGSPHWVMFAWAVGGVLALCGALSYGALARRIPLSGGEYTFLALTIHPAAGFLAGWVSLLAGFTAPIAAAALALQAYLQAAVVLPVRAEWVGTAAVLIAGALHGLRLGPGLAVQNGAVALKLVLLAAFVVYGLAQLPPQSELQSRPPLELSAFAVTLVWISFAYSGWNAAVYLGGEVRDPERNLMRAMGLGTAIVMLLYLGLNAVFVYGAPTDALAGRPEVGAIAAEALGGPGLRSAVSLLVALALFTSISSMVMTGPRVYARMADDGWLPALFASEADVPRAAVALQIVLAIVVIWLSGLVALLGYIGFTLGLSAAATVIGLLRLRHREGAAQVPIPGYPFVPAIFLVGTLGAALFMVVREPLPSFAGLATVAAGLPFYWWRRRSRAVTPAL